MTQSDTVKRLPACFLVWGVLLQLRRRVHYCIDLCVFIQNIALQHTDSANLNLRSQLKPACGSALTPLPAKRHAASYSDYKLRGLSPPLRSTRLGVLSDVDVANSPNHLWEASSTTSCSSVSTESISARIYMVL